MENRNPDLKLMEDRDPDLKLVGLVQMGEKERERRGEPRTLQALADKYGEPVDKFYRWSAIIAEGQLPELHGKRVEVKAIKSAIIEGDIEDDAPEGEAKDKKDERKVRKFLMKACEKGNAQACATLLRLMGKLVEKQEVRVGLTADEIARRNRQAERELGEFERGEAGHRVAEVSKELPLLSKKIRQSKG